MLDRVRSSLRSVPHLDLYASIALLVIGAGLIVFAWGKTASMTDVSLQVPYVVSAGVTGLALVTVGVLAANLSAKRADAAIRREQLESLRTQIDDLTKLLTEGER